VSAHSRALPDEALAGQAVVVGDMCDFRIMSVAAISASPLTSALRYHAELLLQALLERAFSRTKSADGSLRNCIGVRMGK
jgi:hypothetical protein